jgi:hypothetical protein
MPSVSVRTLPDVPVNDRNGLRQSPNHQFRDRLLDYRGSPINWIDNYSTRVTDWLNPACAPQERINPSTRLFGVELEVERRKSTPPDIVGAVYNAMPEFIICKQDGSLDNGFEIVTAPATLEAHRMMWRRFLTNGPDKEKKNPGAWLRGYSSVRCGMHVHVSRASLGPMATARLWKFINDAKLDQYLSRIAGRPISPRDELRYRKRSITNFYMTHPNSRFKDAFYRPTMFDRHSAVNMQNLATLEIRIFRSNTDFVGMLKNLDFVDAACTFCEETPMQFIDGVNFIEWVTSTRVSPRYPYLMKWMARHRVHLLREARKAA